MIKTSSDDLINWWNYQSKHVYFFSLFLFNLIEIFINWCFSQSHSVYLLLKKWKWKYVTVEDLADVAWDYKHYCWKSCIRNTCNWKVHPDLKNVPPWSFTIHVTVYFKNSKFQNQAIRGFWENWLLKTFSPLIEGIFGL